MLIPTQVANREYTVCIPPTVTPERDFVRRYADYADVLEVPRVMHEAVGIQLVASVLNKNGVVIPLGAVTYPLDLWIVLLSGSGAGRNTLLALANPVIQEAKIDDLVRNVQWGSQQAFYQQLSQKPNGLYVWGEFSERMKALNGAQFSGAKEWLTDRYDNLVRPASVVYRVTGKETDTPTIAFGVAPRLNILAGSSEEWFFKNLAVEDSAGGFVPRWLLIRATDPGRDVPIPAFPDKRLVQALGLDLTEIAKLRGAADLSEIADDYSEWYVAAKRRFAAQPNPTLAGVFFNRHRGHVLKLAVIYEASQSGSLIVSDDAWDQAVEMAASVEQTIFSLLGTGMNGEGYALGQMADRIKLAGSDGMTLSEFTRAFQSDNRVSREQRLKTLTAAETVLSFARKTAGRTKGILVHPAHAPAYQSNHPEDKRCDL